MDLTSHGHSGTLHTQPKRLTWEDSYSRIDPLSDQYIIGFFWALIFGICLLCCAVLAQANIYIVIVLCFGNNKLDVSIIIRLRIQDEGLGCNHETLPMYLQ